MGSAMWAEGGKERIRNQDTALTQIARDLCGVLSAHAVESDLGGLQLLDGVLEVRLASVLICADEVCSEVLES